MRKYLLTFIALLGVVGCAPKPYAVNPEPDERGTLETVPESEREGYMRIIGDWRWDQLQEAKDWAEIFPSCAFRHPPESIQSLQRYMEYLRKATNDIDSKISGMDKPYIDDFKSFSAKRIDETASLIEKINQTYIGKSHALKTLADIRGERFYIPIEGDWIDSEVYEKRKRTGEFGISDRLVRGGGFKRLRNYISAPLEDFIKSGSVQVSPASDRSDCSFFLGGINFDLLDVYFYDEPDEKRINKTRLRGINLTVYLPHEWRAFWAAIDEKYTSTSPERIYDRQYKKWCGDYSCFIQVDQQIRIAPTPYVMSVLDAVSVDKSAF